MEQKVLDQKEKYYTALKKSTAEFEDKYGNEADSVMHATAMNMAKKKFAVGESCADPVTKKAKELEESNEEHFTITMVQQALADMDVDTFLKNGMLYVRGTKEDGLRAQKTLAQAGIKMPVRLTEDNDVGQFYKKLGEAAAEKGLSLSQLQEALKAMEKEASKEATEAFNAKKGKIKREKSSAETVVNPMIGESTTNNPAGGYHGTIKKSSEQEGASKYKQAHRVVQEIMKKHGGTPEDTRNYLDSVHGRHIADHVNDGTSIHDAIQKHHGNEKKVGEAMKKVISSRSSF